MTTRTLSIAVALVAAANGATAQRAPSVPPWSRVHAPATFKPDLCVARIVPGNELPSRFAVPSRTIAIVIDKRFRMDVMPVPSRAPGAGFAFAPHDFLCDGKTHHVEVRWPNADPTTHQVMFPVSRPAGARPVAR